MVYVLRCVYKVVRYKMHAIKTYTKWVKMENEPDKKPESKNGLMMRIQICVYPYTHTHSCTCKSLCMCMLNYQCIWLCIMLLNTINVVLWTLWTKCCGRRENERASKKERASKSIFTWSCEWVADKYVRNIRYFKLFDVHCQGLFLHHRIHRFQSWNKIRSSWWFIHGFL